MGLGAEDRRRNAARVRGRWMAAALVAWMLVVQVLSGTAALIHAHGGLGGHLHLVAGGVHQPDHARHELWHRSQHEGLADTHHHGAAAEQDGAAQGSHEDVERVVFAFPKAPPVVDGPSEGVSLPSWEALVTLALAVPAEEGLEAVVAARAASREPGGVPPSGGALPLRI